MKTINKNYIILLLSLICLSCEKKYELASLASFDVKTEKKQYAVGEPVQFIIDGNPENLVFWSGKSGHKYEFRDRTFSDENSVILNFKSYSQFGVVDQSNIKLKVSNDFSGVYDAENLQSANWIDISDRAVWSSGEDQTPSGDVNLDDFAGDGKEMFVAFQYKTETVQNAATQNRWVFRSFDVKSRTPEGSETTMMNMASTDWHEVDLASPDTKWVISSTQVISTRSTTALNDDWVITKPFSKPTAVSPDKGLVVKSISQDLATYTEVYHEAGTYTVVFEAMNVNPKHQRTVIKEVEFTVTEL